MEVQPELTSEEVLFKGRAFSVIERSFEVRGRRISYDVVRRRPAVVIMPLDGGTVYMIKQFRGSIGKWLWEFPAGTLEEGEDPRSCALRELEEETGLKAGRLEELGKFFASPGYTDEVLYSYLATDLEVGESELEEDEILKVFRFPLREVVQMTIRGEIEDSKTLATLALFLIKRVDPSEALQLLMR